MLYRLIVKAMTVEEARDLAGSSGVHVIDDETMGVGSGLVALDAETNISQLQAWFENPNSVLLHYTPVAPGGTLTEIRNALEGKS